MLNLRKHIYIKKVFQSKKHKHVKLAMQKAFVQRRITLKSSNYAKLFKIK